MKKDNYIIIALDGHDGSGKTTLCKLLAASLGGTYVRPFTVEYGESLIRSAEMKNYHETISIGEEAIREACNNHEGGLLIMDRHWMTVLSLLPKVWHSRWYMFPPVILCWCDLHTTKQRIASRNEEKFSDNYHSYYLETYKKLAHFYDVPVIDTGNNSINTSIFEIINWLKNNKIKL